MHKVVNRSHPGERIVSDGELRTYLSEPRSSMARLVAFVVAVAQSVAFGDVQPGVPRYESYPPRDLEPPSGANAALLTWLSDDARLRACYVLRRSTLLDNRAGAGLDRKRRFPRVSRCNPGS